MHRSKTLAYSDAIDIAGCATEMVDKIWP